MYIKFLNNFFNIMRGEPNAISTMGKLIFTSNLVVSLPILLFKSSIKFNPTYPTYK